MYCASPGSVTPQYRKDRRICIDAVVILAGGGVRNRSSAYQIQECVTFTQSWAKARPLYAIFILPEPSQSIEVELPV